MEITVNITVNGVPFGSSKKVYADTEADPKIIAPQYPIVAPRPPTIAPPYQLVSPQSPFIKDYTRDEEVLFSY